MTSPARTEVPRALLGALGGLAAFGVVVLVGLLVWIFVIEPSHAKAGGVSTADLSLGVTATPARVQAGAAITYAFTVRNAGPDSATDVTLSDPLPVGVSLRSAKSSSGSCSGKSSVSCALGDLKKNASVQVEVVVSAPRRGTVSNAAQVSSATDDPDSSNDPAIATTQVEAAAASADLKISGLAKPEKVRVGKRLTFTYSIENAGPDPASHVTFTDALPPDLKIESIATPVGGQCPSTSAGFQCGIGDVDSGAHAIVVVVVIPKQAGSLSTVASVSSQATDPDISNNSSPVTASVSAGSGGGKPRPKPKPTGSPALTVYFCGAVTQHPPFHCLTAYTYDQSTGVHRIPAAASWTIWIRVRGASKGDRVETHYIDTSTHQAAFNADHWALADGANELVQRWRGPWSPKLRFETVIFYNGSRVNFDPPLLVQFY